MDHGGGQVVSVQAEFESRWCLQFVCKNVVEKNENNWKEAGVGS